MIITDNVDEDKKIKFIIISGIGVILILTIAIFLLIYIWSNDKQVNDKNQTNIVEENENLIYDDYNQISDAGKYNDVSWNIAKQVKFYESLFCDNVKIKNISKISSLLGNDYKQYYNLDDSKIIELLEKKKIWGKKIYVSDYEYTKYRGSRIIKMHIISNDNVVNDYVNVYEWSPKEFSMSLDGFVSFRNDERKFVRENLEFTLLDELIMNNKYKIKVKIKNLTEQDVVLNKSKEYENIYLKFNNLNPRRVDSTVFAGETFKITPNSEFNTMLEFNIESLSFSKIQKIIFNNITFLGINETKNISIEI